VNTLLIAAGVAISLIIVPIGLKEIVDQKWITKKERKLTLAITTPIYITIIIIAVYYS